MSQLESESAKAARAATYCTYPWGCLPKSRSLVNPLFNAQNLCTGNQLSFFVLVANLTLSCRFLLYDINRTKPFLLTEGNRVLIQLPVFLRLDYCNSQLAGLPCIKSIRSLKLMENAASHLDFSLPKFPHITQSSTISQNIRETSIKTLQTLCWHPCRGGLLGSTHHVNKLAPPPLPWPPLAPLSPP